jgi:hypothetical protein
MAIQVNITTTAGQDNKLAKILTVINTQRVQQGQTAYADVNAMCTDALITQLLSWAAQADTVDVQNVDTAYRSATNQQQNQVKTILGIS